MKKINKKRVFLLIILICLLILQIKAFKNSQANKLVETTLVAKDNKSILEDALVTIEATSEGESGYVLVLPGIINEKKVSKYYITEKNIENEEITNKDIEKEPGTKIYLTDEEIEIKKVELKVEYDSITKDEKILYNQQINTKLDDKIIQVKAYIEDGIEVKIENKEKEDIAQIDNYLTDYTFNSAYDISLEKEKSENVVTFGNIIISIEEKELDKNKEYKIIHITDNEKIEEIEKIELSDNKIEFETQTLSTFVILEKENISNVVQNEIQEPDRKSVV